MDQAWAVAAALLAAARVVRLAEALAAPQAEAAGRAGSRGDVVARGVGAAAKPVARHGCRKPRGKWNPRSS